MAARFKDIKAYLAGRFGPIDYLVLMPASKALDCELCGRSLDGEEYLSFFVYDDQERLVTCLDLAACQVRGDVRVSACQNRLEAAVTLPDGEG